MKPMVAIKIGNIRKGSDDVKKALLQKDGAEKVDAVTK